MSERTPTTEQIRKGLLTGYVSDSEFDRWLNQVKAEAWDEGYNSKWYDPDDLWQDNPYGQGEK